MTLESVQILKKNWIRGFRYDMRNLVNFHQITQKSENLFSMSSFCPKYARSELQKYRGVIFHDTEEWCKIWINFDVVVSKSAWGNELTFIGALKNLENCTLMGFLCPKHIIFQLENFIGVMFHDTEGWAKFKVKLTPGLKNVIRNLVNFHASSRKSENFNFNRLLLSKTYKVLDEKVQKNYISWH